MLIRDVLKSIALFRALDDEGLAALAGTGRERQIEPGDVVFAQGDTGDALFIVVSGAVRIHTLDEGHELVLSIIREGEYFGEMSLIDGAPRSASATACEPGRLFVIMREEYRKLLPPWFEQMLTELFLRLTNNLRESNVHRFGLVREKESLRAASELERLRSLSEMVAGVAHEINTPLGIIHNAATFVTESLSRDAIARLAKDADDEELLGDVADACQLIQNNVTAASRLIQAFKSLSVRQIVDQRETVDIVECVEEVVTTFRFKARAARLEIEVSSALGDGDRTWSGYPGHLSQVILNLFTNIERYAYATGEGGRVEVTVSGLEMKPSVSGFQVTVRDFGKGIPEADLGRIFNPFFTTGRDREGTGLGLAIVYNIMTSSLCGSVRAVSTPGEGAMFTLQFPRVIPEGAQL